MADTSIATQTTLRDIRVALNTLAANLNYHSNASLAKAHSLTAISFGAPVYDSNGNDIQYYRDSGGDIVGRYQLRFTVSDTVYYAPGQTTVLPGQTTTGSITEADVDALMARVERSAWVTVFSQEYVDQINAVRDGILLPHTLLGHWEVHTTPIVYPKETFDSQGHRVGRYRAVLQVAGVKYEVPCDTRLGGPPQAMRWSGFGLATNLSFTTNGVTSNKDNDQPGYFYYRDGTGTVPRSVILQVTPNPQAVNPVWADVPIGGASYLYTSGYGWNFEVAAYSVPAYPVASYMFSLLAHAGGEGNRTVCGVRAKVTGLDGVVSYTNWCIFKANDTDDSCTGSEDTNMYPWLA